MRTEEMKKLFEGVKTATPYKMPKDHNPVMTQRFGADPYALVYEGRVYLYLTGDKITYDEKGEMEENTYSKIDTINVISSSDLVNWTDHGFVYAAGKDGAANWGDNSWAPAAAMKVIDGKPKFFLYFANSGNGIAVLTSDSPVGPFVDPIGKALVSRETPTCADVTWLFDPAVLVDDDGTGYLYFGGGVPSLDKVAEPGTARVAKLKDDMISLSGDPVVIADVAYLFEDSGINKIGDTYYYSYCSNFDVPEEKAEEIGFHSGEIIMMTSKNPMGPFTYYGPVLKNPEYYFERGGNNHHCMFEFKNQWYMSYHTRILEEAMGINLGYRSTNIDIVEFDEQGQPKMITGTRKGVVQTQRMNPYEKNQAVTMAALSGMTTTQYGCDSEKNGTGEMILTEIKDGSWMSVYGVDFGTKHVEELTVSARGKGIGYLKVCMDALDGEAIAYLELAPESEKELKEQTTKLEKKINGVHDLYFVFLGEGYEVKDWIFQ